MVEFGCLGLKRVWGDGKVYRGGCRLSGVILWYVRGRRRCDGRMLCLEGARHLTPVDPDGKRNPPVIFTATLTRDEVPVQAH